jgi:vitamin B12/bleomycin/antimicrobial peptide transport system ATP-binding/permease protein
VKLLSVCVAAAAASSWFAGIIKGGGGVLGLAAEPLLAGIGGVGLVLAVATFRSPLISPFLRVFSTIFAVEYIVTGLAFVAVEAEWWPQSFAEAAPRRAFPSRLRSLDCSSI